MLESLKELVKNKVPGTLPDSKAVDVGRDQDWILCSAVHTGQRWGLTFQPPAFSRACPPTLPAVPHPLTL